jgi:tetratricopeptide (TPR) repeat protein
LAANGEALLRAGQVFKALESFGAAAALRPASAEAHLNLARAFIAADRYEAARQALTVARSCAQHAGAGPAVASAIDREWRALPLDPPRRGNFQRGQTLCSGLTGQRWTVIADPILGGLGVVYKVRDQADGMVYALKTFQARLIWNEESRRQFRREAANWMRLKPHPHIVSANWIETIDDFPCIVQEFVDGGDLDHVLRTQRMPLSWVLELSLQFCDAVLFAHQSIGLVHRDVKPSNCLLSSRGLLKVGDFGISRCVSDVASTFLGLDDIDDSVRVKYTRPIGTLAYMAPEQHRWTAELDTRTDIHAFGVMLFEMATGAEPYDPEGDRSGYTYIRSKMGDYELPRPWWDLILHCLQPATEDRPTNFAEVRATLEELYRREVKRDAPRPSASARPDAGYWQNRAVAFQVLEMFEDAVRCCDEALKLEKDNGDLWQNRGAILHRMSRNEEALTSLERAISLGVEDADVFNNLGLVLRALGRDGEALLRLETASALDPRDSRIAKNRAELLLSLGRGTEALAVIDSLPAEVIREVPLDEARLFILIALERLAEAQRAAELLEQRAPRRFGVWRAKAICADKAGDRVAALEACRRALEIDHENGEMREMRNRLASDHHGE